MSKRKIKEEVAGPPVSDDSIGSKRRRRGDEARETQDEISNKFDLMKTYRNENGRYPSDILIRISRERLLSPGPGETESMISWFKIEDNVNSSCYDSPSDLFKDIDLLLQTCKGYCQVLSENYQDLCSLERVAQEMKSSLPESEKIPFQELLEAVYTLQDEGRPVWEMFHSLPSRQDYPEYYQVIKEPIDLMTMKQKIEENKYNSLQDLEKDFATLVKNAHTFNEPGSQIYKDASLIKKAVASKKVELEKGVLGAKISDRIKSRHNSLSRTHSHQSHDSDVESTATEDDVCSRVSQEATSSTRKDDGTLPDDGSIHIKFYNAILQFSDSYGRVLSEPFLRLPSKRAYPDYYSVIRKPMALMRIRSRVKAGHYANLDALADDMNLVFNNAQQYNEDDSLLYKDAVSIQNFMKEIKPDMDKAEETQMKAVKVEDGSTPVAPRKRGRHVEMDPKVLKKRLKQLYNAVQSHQDDTGRTLSDIFMELPSAEEYPDYYRVITQPMDLLTIEGKIKNRKYSTEESCIHDFEIMFANARHYNEEGSQVYEDSVILEKILKKKKRSLGAVNPDGTPKQSPAKAKMSSSPAGVNKKLPMNSSTPPANDCQLLLQHITNYKDGCGRYLCTIFEHLPAKSHRNKIHQQDAAHFPRVCFIFKQDYPDYYVLIKKPIDLAKISSKVELGQYSNLEDLEQDLLLMFDNACRYNEPDSQVYKDALTLQRAMIRKKAQIIGAENEVSPDVQELVQQLLRNLYESVMNYKLLLSGTTEKQIKHLQDEEGRCYSDSLSELDVLDETHKETAKPRKPLTLGIIGKLLKKGMYRRLDRLQEDMFLILQKARQISRTDSEMYEDAIELQQQFISERDRLTKDGQRLVSQALNFTRKHLQQDIEDERKRKHEYESVEDAKSKSEDWKRSHMEDEIKVSDESELVYVPEISLGENTYRVGDFLYIESIEERKVPHIVLIDKLWTDQAGNQGMYCCWFYRPEETFHLASRKFLEKEVFKSDHFSHLPFTRIRARCHVMSVKDYFKIKPQNFHDEDIYCCESRYHVKTRVFKKIKVWPWTGAHVKLVSRETPLQPRRVSSVFANEPSKSEKNEKPIESSESSEMELDDKALSEYLLKEEIKNIEKDIPGGEEGCTYYEQYCLQAGYYRIGDSVYVRSDEEYPYMARIDKIWTDKDGNAYFHGNWYLRPEEAKHMPTRMFYEQECFQSNIEDTNPMASIMGKCFIMHIKDYVISRPTEMLELDIFLCESRYDEGDGHIRKLKGLKRPPLLGSIRDYEFYYFEQPCNLKKKPSPLLISPKATSVDNSQPEGDDYDEEDDAESTEGSKRGPKRLRERAGYCLFASEVAASLRRINPAVSEDEIQKNVLTEWRSLGVTKKAELEARARAQGLQPTAPDDGSILIYECGWKGCDHQYEDIQDLMVHVMEIGGHITKGENNEYPCYWFECVRTKRELPPFPTYSKLARHIREVHFKVASKRIQPHEKSRNYFRRHQAAEHTLEPPMPMVEDDIRPERPSSQGSLPPSGSPGHPSRKVPQNRQLPPGLPFPPQMPGEIPMQPPIPMPFRMTHAQQQMLQQQQQQQQQQQRLMMARSMPMGSIPGGTPPVTVPGGPGQMPPNIPPPGMPLQQPLNIEQQQLLMQQLQRQQQQIQKLTQQVQQLAARQATAEEEPTFVTPPPNTQKLRHSEAYLRYIEGLRDGRQYLSNWSEMSQSQNKPNPQGRLPVHWLGGNTFGHNNTTDALWALRDHMLKDAITF